MIKRTPKHTPEWCMYLLVRTDLASMNPGKAMAQSHHAGTQLLAHASHPYVKEYIAQGKKEGADCFSTTLCLGASINDIHTAMKNSAHIMKTPKNFKTKPLILFGVVEDPTYPFFTDVENAEVHLNSGAAQWIKQYPSGKVLMTRKETTCAWFLVDKTDQELCKNLFGHLKLHP